MNIIRKRVCHVRNVVCVILDDTKALVRLMSAFTRGLVSWTRLCCDGVFFFLFSFVSRINDCNIGGGACSM